jgi:hypothetical protein
VRENFSATSGSTSLEIVWRNPACVPSNEQRLDRLVNDDYGAAYAARGSDRTTVFEVIRRRVNEATADSIADDPLHKTRVRMEEFLRKVR